MGDEYDNADDPGYEVYDDDASVHLGEEDGLNEDNSNANMDRLPLVPTDFSNVVEALQNFTVVFESRYGGLHPRFQCTSLKAALNLAFGVTSKVPVMEQRPLILYLHHDDSVASNIFAERVVCTDAITSLLNCQFVLWPWDMTQPDNRTKLYEWLIENNLLLVKDYLKQVAKDEYPALFVLLKDRTKYECDYPINGTESVDSVMGKLLTSLDKFQEIKNRDLAEEHNRLEREQIRQEQVTEYEKSLAIDRAKQEEQQRQRKQEIQEQEEEQRRLEEKQERCALLASTLPAEPAETETNVVTVRVRFPNGSNKQRRFEMKDPTILLLQFIASEGYDMDVHRVFISGIPRTDMSTLDVSKSFAQLGWSKREMVTVDEK